MIGRVLPSYAGYAVGKAAVKTMAAVLRHGDFRLGNTLAKEGRVRAVIDWEIWTVGDPRVDLAWYLMSTHSSKQRCAVRDVDGMPSDEELTRQRKNTAIRPATRTGRSEASHSNVSPDVVAARSGLLASLTLDGPARTWAPTGTIAGKRTRSSP